GGERRRLYQLAGRGADLVVGLAADAAGLAHDELTQLGRSARQRGPPRPGPRRSPRPTCAGPRGRWRRPRRRRPDRPGRRRRISRRTPCPGRSAARRRLALGTRRQRRSPRSTGSRPSCTPSQSLPAWARLGSAFPTARNASRRFAAAQGLTWAQLRPSPRVVRTECAHAWQALSRSGTGTPNPYRVAPGLAASSPPVSLVVAGG